MKSLIFLTLLTLITSCMSIEDELRYKVLKYDVYDIPAKSQIDMRVSLKDSLLNKTGLDSILRQCIDICNAGKMQYNPKATHIFVYIYRTEADFNTNGSNWIAAYMKSGVDDKGEYQYK